jgi:4-amino-4-deoxy-L-arabinose transferase-like glycosyltransferase
MKIRKFNITHNPFLLFLPFLILYVAVILIFAKNISDGDEGKYLMYAQNLSQGFYTSLSNLDLGNGPGYPIIITPFVALNFSLICIKLLNALFYYFSNILLYKALQQVVPFKFALIFSIIWALYPNTFESMPYVLTEVFASSLIPLIIFTLIKAFKNNNTKKALKYILFAGLSIGYLALTKPIFGYVLIFMIGGTFLLWIINVTNENLKKSIVVLIIAFFTTIPWLVYTYHISGKMFYWSSYGGNNLYWMSSPYEGESGSWIEYPFDKIGTQIRIEGSNKIIDSLHKNDFNEINKYKGLKEDDIYKKIAINNIKSHPFKFIKNCFSNVGRMLFNFPYSYKLQKPETLVRLPFNGIILVFILFCIIPTVINWRKIVFPLRFLLFFSFLYFGGSILGSAETRMFTMIVPILLFWIAYTIPKSVKIKMHWQ